MNPRRIRRCPLFFRPPSREGTTRPGLGLAMGWRLRLRKFAFRDEIRKRDEHKDEKRDANIDKRKRYRGDVKEQQIEILELDNAMEANEIGITAVVPNNGEAQQQERNRA